MRRWRSPAIRNVNCGMEVTSYESADIDSDLIGPDSVGRWTTERSATRAR